MSNLIGWFFGGLAIILSFYFSVRLLNIGRGKIVLQNPRYSTKKYTVMGWVNLAFSVILAIFLIALFLW